MTGELQYNAPKMLELLKWIEQCPDKKVKKELIKVYRSRDLFQIHLQAMLSIFIGTVLIESVAGVTSKHKKKKG